MTINIRVLLFIFAIGTTIFALILSDIYTNPTKEIIITRTNSGFEPEVITIENGQVVKFVTNTSSSFWPASDSHPTHGRYSEFDPTKSISPIESWSFKFDKPGVWKFHDHLNSQFTGKILVVGKEGESVRNCLEDSSYRVEADCWETEFSSIIKSDGLIAAFDKFRKFYDESDVFRRNCHDVTHLIGNIAYNQFQNTYKAIDRQETGFCGFGFYHGFIESALADRGPSFYHEGRKYCESLSDSDSFVTEKEKREAAGACMHGFGHAIFDSIEGKYWGDAKAMVEQSINVCKIIFTEDRARKSCSSGVYNSLAIAYNENMYDLQFDNSDPTNICTKQEKIYKDGCFIEVGIYYVRNQGFNREEILSFIESIRAKGGATPMIAAYVDDEVRYSKTPPTLIEIRDLCMSFSNDYDKLSCVSGGVSGLRKGGAPGEERTKMRKFCSYLKNTGEPERLCLSLSE